MSRIRARVRRVPLPLGLMLAVAFLLSLAWGFATAPLQGPDEIEHIGYTARLAESGTIPDPVEGEQSAGDDQLYAVGPLGFGRVIQNRAARPPWSELAEREFERFEEGLEDGSAGRGDGPNPLGRNPPLVYAVNAIGWKLTPGTDYFDRVFVLRLMSALAIVAMTLFAWLAAGEVFRRRRLPQTVTAGVAAMLPMAGFMGGLVTTDSWLAAVWAAFTWLSLRYVRVGPTPGGAAGLAGLAVASLLIHGRGLAILPALVAVLVIAAVRHRPPRRATARTGVAAFGTLGAGLLAFRLVTAAGGSGGSLYGGEVTLDRGGTAAFSIRQLVSFIWQFYLPRLDSMAERPGAPIGFRQIVVQQYLGGVFASFEVYFPFWVYDTVQVLFVGGVIALWTIAAMRWRALKAHWPVLAVLAAVLLSLAAFLHVASYRAVYQGGENPLIVGRYLLALTPILGIAVAALVCSAGRRTRAVLAGGVLTALGFLSVAGIALSVERFYV